jgi:hypothetical protein
MLYVAATGSLPVPARPETVPLNCPYGSVKLPGALKVVVTLEAPPIQLFLKFVAFVIFAHYTV